MSANAELHRVSALTTDRPDRRDLMLVFVLVACTLALYFRTAWFSYVLFDDQLYITANPMVIQGLSLRSLRWALTATPNGNWHPLTTIVQLTIATLFGINHPGAYHLLNALLHTLNAALLYLFLRRCTGLTWLAFFTALLWAVHPLHVESVAWISELKDVLYGCFWLAGMLAYMHYSNRRTWGRYTLVFAFVLLSLLSKPMAVTFPAALLLLDYWPLSRSALDNIGTSQLRWWLFRVLEKLPLLAVCIGDLFAQPNPISLVSPLFPLDARIENAIVSYVWYLRDLFFPHHLAIFYPHPVLTQQPIPIWEVVSAGIVLLIISIAVLLRRKSQPYLAVGWFWFLGTLVPVIGLIQSGEQSRADRFTYLPSVGIILAVVWWVHDLVQSRRINQAFAIAAGALAAVMLIGVSTLDITPWKDTDTLFNDLYALQPDNYFAIAMKASFEMTAGHFKEAIALDDRAIKIAPRSFNTHGAYGYVLWNAGDLTGARAQYETALVMNTKVPQNWFGLGEVYESEAAHAADRHDATAETNFRIKAINDFRHAVVNDPLNPDFKDYLATELARTGKIDEAIAIWEEIVNMLPSAASAQGNLADAYRVKQDLPRAVAHYQAALAAGSKNPGWEVQLAWLMATNPLATPADIQPLLAIAKDACEQSHQQSAAAFDAYAACLARTGQFDYAVAAAQQGIAAANAAKEPAVAAGIQRRLHLYQNEQPYVAGIFATTTGPTSNPSNPTTKK